MLLPDLHPFLRIMEKYRWFSKQTRKTHCCDTYTACTENISASFTSFTFSSLTISEIIFIILFTVVFVRAS